MTTDFDEIWRRVTSALQEPAIYEVPESGERFHAWYDPGGDGKPEAVWTKPLQGERQVRLPQHADDYRKVFEAVRAGACTSAADCRALTARGHYLYTVLRRHGL